MWLVDINPLLHININRKPGGHRNVYIHNSISFPNVIVKNWPRNFYKLFSITDSLAAMLLPIALVCKQLTLNQLAKTNSSSTKIVE